MIFETLLTTCVALCQYTLEAWSLKQGSQTDISRTACGPPTWSIWPSMMLTWLKLCAVRESLEFETPVLEQMHKTVVLNTNKGNLAFFKEIPINFNSFKNKNILIKYFNLLLIKIHLLTPTLLSKLLIALNTRIP